MCGGSWGNCYVSRFSKKVKGCIQRRKGVFCRWRRRCRLPPSSPPRNCHSRPPGVRLPEVTGSSLTLHLALLGSRCGARTLLNAVCRAAFAMRSPRPPGTRDAPTSAGLRHLPAAPGPAPPALGSPPATPISTALSRPSRIRKAICDLPTAHVGRGPRQQPWKIIQTPLQLLAPRILCARSQSPRPGSNPRALEPDFRGGGLDQSAEAEVEVGVTTARGRAETAQGAGV